jgi:hypothetical protein
MRRTLLLFTVVAWLALTGNVRADVIVHYDGPHPIDPGTHKGMCMIEGPHVHSYRPHKPVLYVKVKGHWSFIGDPVEFEPEGPKYLYHSHHPVFWIDEDGDPTTVDHYCYITGPHYHVYAPPPEMKFVLKGGVYWYVGDRPTWYEARWRRRRHINRHYAVVHVPRPVITVEPPVGFVGVVVGPGVHAHGHVGVRGGVHVVPPRVGIDVRLPGVGVVFGPGHPRPRHVHVRGPRPGRVKYKYKHKVKVKHRGPRGRGKGKWK